MFTSESKVNIAVTSGQVKVTATVDEESLKLYSATTEETDSVAGEIESGAYAGTYYYEEVSPKFTNGGAATFGTNANGEQKLTLDRVTPGDKVTFDIDILNESNVKIKYRTRVDVVGGDDTLFSVLNVTIYNEDAPENVTISQWKEWLPTEANVKNEKTVKIEIALPITVGNDYKNKTIELSFAVEAVQGNAAWALLDQINTTLANQAVAHTTMYDALADIADIADESVIKESGFIWNSETDRFTTESAATGDKVKYFKDSMPTEQTYSIYASNAWTTANVDNLTVGFDAGNASGISSVTYDRSAATVGQTAIIRTNSSSTALTINAPYDVVKHYGTVGSVNIIAVAGQSYHENGTVAFLEIANGRVALESEAKVTQIHLNVTEVENKKVFNDITIAKAESVTMPKFSRDSIEVDEEKGTLVVALQSDTAEDAEKDYVWLTAIGVYEQVTVSASNTEAGTTFAAESGSEEQKDAAQQIANNITATVDGNKYNLTATKTGATWTYALESETEEDITENVTVDISDDETIIVSVAGAEQTTVTENGITEDAKEEAKADAVIEVIEDERKDFDKNNYWIFAAAENFAGGDGTEEHPYLIATAEQLAKLAYGYMGDNYEEYQGKYYKLTADIDLSARIWVPIANCARGQFTEKYFSGVFDGNHHTIKGLNNIGMDIAYIVTMTNDTTPLGADGESTYGLFGCVNDATISNLTMEDVYVNTKAYESKKDHNGATLTILGDSVGSVCGYVNYGKTLTLIGVHIENGTVIGYDSVGGIVGRSYGNISLTDCYNKANVTSSRRVGGLLGYKNNYSMQNIVNDTENNSSSHTYSGNTITFANCYNEGVVTCNIDSDYAFNVNYYSASDLISFAQDHGYVLEKKPAGYAQDKQVNANNVRIIYQGETYLFASYISQAGENLLNLGVKQ